MCVDHTRDEKEQEFRALRGPFRGREVYIVPSEFGILLVLFSIYDEEKTEEKKKNNTDLFKFRFCCTESQGHEMYTTTLTPLQSNNKTTLRPHKNITIHHKVSSCQDNRSIKI
jgi:hypothetical protein